MHDGHYKRLFSFPRTVADLLHAVADERLVRELDFTGLEKLPAEYIGKRGQRRLGDCVWRLPFLDGWLYLLVLLEFQSGRDSLMALRNLEYTALLYTELERTGKLGTPGDWPPVLPLVLYNGDAPWTDEVQMRHLIGRTSLLLEPCQPSQRSLVLDERHIALDDLPLGNLMRAVAGLEQSRTPQQLAQWVVALREWLDSPSDTELGGAFVAWIQDMANRVEPGASLDLGNTLEEASMSLVDRVAQWPEQWRSEGRSEGRNEGQGEGMAKALHAIAKQRFGAETSARLAALLPSIDDADRVTEVNQWITSSRTGDELIERVSGKQA